MTAWTDAARMMKITLAVLLTCRPAIWESTMAAPTIRISPSASKPSCVIQLKKLINFEPWVPKGARVIAKAVVPVSGPCSDASPSRRNERLPITIRLMATGKLKPNPINKAP